MDQRQNNYQILNHVLLRLPDSNNVFGSVDYLTTVRGIKDYGKFYELEGFAVVKPVEEILGVWLTKDLLAELGFRKITEDMSCFEENNVMIYLLEKKLERAKASIYHICEDKLPTWEESMYSTGDLFYLHELQNAVMHKHKLRLALPDLFRKL